MKQKLLTRLVLASLAGAAVVGVQAGQIQSSSTAIAREVITTNAQAVNAPSVTYRFAGDVNATVQAQTFQVQFKLADGADTSTSGATTSASSASWGATLPSDNAFAITNGITAAVLASGTDYVVVAKNISNTATGKILWVTFRVETVAGLVQQPIITLNAVGATTPATIVTLKDVVGDIIADYNSSPVNARVCVADKFARVGVEHFVALSNPSSIAGVGNGQPDEHLRSGNTSKAPFLTFPTNISAAFTPATGGTRLQSGGNRFFDSTGEGAVVASALPAVPGTAHVIAAGPGQTTVRLGIARLVQNAQGLDSDLVTNYLLAPAVTFGATAAGNTGTVEGKRLDVTVSASSGFVAGGTLFAALVGNNCAAVAEPGATVAITAANAAGPITIPVILPATLGTGADPVEICYSVPLTNTTTIPSSTFSGVARLFKADPAPGLNEQDNICNGPLYSLGGGLKIDVRNYASSAETSGYTSVLRIINNSDTSTADVWAQHINQDGKLGNWANLGTLAPRAVMNMRADQIDAKLAAGNAATAAVGTAAPTAQAATTTTSDNAPRLRIVSASGTSLRVQNYLFNAATGQILEGSGSQGVDYDIPGATGNARTGTNDQGISQDANSGLNLQK
jgi:hypothetical protein